MPVGPNRLLAFALILGVYLSTRGYHSRDGDQAFRLPLLLHQQNAPVFADDPFVRAVDDFNPHKGYLRLIDAVSRPLGLSLALLTIYLATFAATCFGVDRLARRVWPKAGPGVGLAAVILVLLARAGNIGTNHLFDGVLLDRLVATSIGWLAFSSAIDQENRRAAILVGLAALVHPALGLQLGMALGVSWVFWSLIPACRDCSGRVTRLDLFKNSICLSLSLLPSVLLMASQSGRLLAGLPEAEIWRLSVELQSPQHMLPHLWRKPQWLAWGAYFLVALISLTGVGTAQLKETRSVARTRLVVSLNLILSALALATVGIEAIHNLRLTMFQPFRMATFARGLALILIAGRVQALWNRGDLGGKVRATLIAVGLAGDWMFVVAACVESAVSFTQGLRVSPFWSNLVGAIVFVLGLVFLHRHDTEQGQWALLSAAIGVLTWGSLRRVFRLEWNRRRVGLALTAAWLVPISAFVIPPVFGVESNRPLVSALATRCRFWATPLDDVERLAVWSRDHTAHDARFIGPPGPKGFRLWSLRSLAFNRAGSPYHAEGLADWSKRFRDHVGFEGSNAEFVADYLTDRLALEKRFNDLTGEQLVALAKRQGATHLLVGHPLASPSGSLELLRVEGRYAVYRLSETPKTSKVKRETSPHKSAGTG